MNWMIRFRHFTLLILAVFPGCSNPKSNLDTKNETSKTNTKQVQTSENTTEEKDHSKKDIDEPDPFKTLRDMSPVKVAKYHFAAATNGEQDQFFNTCILPRNKTARDTFVKQDFKNIRAFYDRYEIKVIEGKTIGNLAIVGRCDLDTSGILQDIDAILLRKTDQCWKVIMAQNFISAKHELTEKEDLHSYSKIFEWLKANPTALKDRFKKENG